MLGNVLPYLQNPVTGIGLVLLLVFGVHRALLRSGLLRPVSARMSGTLIRLVLHYGFAIAIIVILCGFALAFWNAAHATKAPLTRLDAETLLQRQRGNIQRCIKPLGDVQTLFFIFGYDGISRINVDVVVGPARRDVPHGFRAPSQTKLAISHPDVNLCLMEALKRTLNDYVLKAPDEGFAHVFIVDA